LPSETIAAAARRHDPSAYAATLRYRPDAAMPFDLAASPSLHYCRSQ
jgi:hypothetical protein